MCIWIPLGSGGSSRRCGTLSSTRSHNIARAMSSAGAISMAGAEGRKMSEDKEGY